MPTNVPLPALGESVTEGTVSRWLKQVGDTVEVDEPIVEVSTDKVDTEVPSPVSGLILQIMVPEDETAEVGATLAVIGDPSEAVGAQPTGIPAPEAASQPEPPKADPVPAASAPTPATSVPASGTEISLPALGESVTEGTISRWLKQVGDTVEVDEPIVEVSTDKVDTEVPSPAAGTLLEIRVAEDETAAVGAVLAIVGAANSVPAPVLPATPAPPQQTSAPAPEAPARQSSDQQPAPVPAVPRRASGQAPDFGYVTPLVRKLANQHGIELSSIQGTGVGGRIRKQDVLDAAEAAKAPVVQVPPAAPAVATTTTKATIPAKPSPKRGTTEKLNRLRSTIAKRMTESLQTAAQLTATVEVDLTNISNLRAQIKDAFKAREGVSLSYLPFIAMASVEGLKQFPVVNAEINMEQGTITYPAAEHLGIAVDTERGLLVPVVQDADNLNLTGLAKKIGDLAARTRGNKVTPDELTGGTFTITNYGSAGTLFDTPIINQPQSAILGTGALVKRPMVITDAALGEVIAVRDMMYLSLTYDHRIIDGAIAARFLSFVKARLEEGDFCAEFGL